MKQKSEKRFPKFANFGEYLFWSYANLQMLCATLNMGKTKYMELQAYINENL